MRGHVGENEPFPAVGVNWRGHVGENWRGHVGWLRCAFGAASAPENASQNCREV